MVAILAGATTSPPVALGWVAPEWVHGADAIGMGETGVAAIGMAATGAVVTGMAATGTIGMGIGIITVTIMSSSSAISAFQDGGAGAGDTPMDTATGIRMVITGMGIRTVMVTATEIMDTVTTATGTAMDMATVLAASTALVVNTALPLARE